MESEETKQFTAALLQFQMLQVKRSGTQCTRTSPAQASLLQMGTVQEYSQSSCRASMYFNGCTKENPD